MTIFPQRLLLRDSPHHFRMVWAFVVVSFVAIFSTALAMSTILSRYIVEQMMLRDTAVSGEFLNSVVQVENAVSYFTGAESLTGDEDFEEFLIHVAGMPDVFRANIYDAGHTILWSTEPDLVGESFRDNTELDAALNGISIPELNAVDADEKSEHVGFPQGITTYIEYYIPITASEGGAVVGAVEVYKSPASLLGSIRRIKMLSWINALLAGAALFGGLALVVTYAGRVLMRQEARLVETERLAAVGEMASAVAHGLRNPLASIRSCAELTLDDDIPEDSRSTLRDIIDQVDRLEGWIRDLLGRSRKDAGASSQRADVEKVVRACLGAFRPQMERRGIRLRLTGSGRMFVGARAPELEQVLNSVIANGLEAMGSGGLLDIGWDRDGADMITIRVQDTGPGIAADMVDRLFTPFATGKASGLGVGLSLGRRIAERLGGTLELANGASHGAEVTLRLPAA